VNGTKAKRMGAKDSTVPRDVILRVKQRGFRLPNNGN
jgi:hypothetical protein